MRISFHGAAREVTGSCYLVETKNSRVLIDCGMFQGAAFTDAKNFQDFGFNPRTIDAVIVTHAHLDHVGRLPKLAKEKYKGKIYLTPPTADIAKIVLKDAEQIMQDDFRREGRPKLYERENIEKTLSLFSKTDYGKKITVGDLTFRFHDAGHIFGSAFVEIEEKAGPRAVFSGDLGNRNVPILRPTERMVQADAVIIESTYGNRLHEDETARGRKLKETVARTAKQKGVLIIPAFAVERTQQLLFELNHLVENRLTPAVDIYLDSPMAIEVTSVINSYPKYYNKEALRLVSMGDDFFNFPGLRLSRSRDDSKLINEAPRPKIIIAGAGMMNGGRILHHLVRYLNDAKSKLLIIGYQARGTLGRRLYSGEKHVRVMNEKVEVKAEILSIGAYSAHADRRRLIEWLSGAGEKPQRVFCTHGEEDVAAALATHILEELRIPATVPRMGDVVEI